MKQYPTISYVSGYPIGRAPDDVLVESLARLPTPSKAWYLDFSYGMSWWDLVDECKFRQLLPDWEAWSRDAELLQ
jgi:hypothetical protein